ncbi:MAG: branched-chain amino acid ABC transporter substrate-binding protein [Chloroflexi bacterium]|nr:branched-chain amino acid ABC transporter substrate-binding protein [Chloroflexota bacterium]
MKIAIELPLEGSELAASQPIINGVRLAIMDHGGAAGGYAVSTPDEAIYDDSVNGVHDPLTGAQNMQTIVADDSIAAVIGPLNSSVALTQIPISNEAGLLQCSPANTNQGLTKPEFGALNVRAFNPEQINYVRVVTTDDYQGPAAAKFIFENLGKKSVYIIDDTETFGKGIADTFQAEFEELGGTVTKREGVDISTGPDYNSIMTEAASGNPEAIYFGGVTATGGARILLAAAEAGLGDIPFVGPDGINDGNGGTADSFLNLAGDAAANSYSTLAGIGDFPAQADFDAAYQAEYDEASTGYAATGYACAEVVLDAIDRAGATAPADMAGLREAVRAAAVDTSVTYGTILGDVQFDENGDTNQLIISFYTYDPEGADGAGDWVFDTQVDFAEGG